MEPRSRPYLAAVYMTGAVLSFTLMSVAGRSASATHDTFEIMLYRSILGIGIVLLFARMTRRMHELPTRRFGLHLVRNIAHFTGQNLWFFALPLIPLAQMFAFEFTTPIWVALFAPLFLPERFSGQRLFAALLGFAGILIVARPSGLDLGPGVYAAFFCAFGFAGAIIATKKLSQTETVACILFWLTVTQAVFGLVTAGMDGHITMPTAASLPWLFIIGCCGLFSHWCITNALSIAPASLVSPLEFTRLPLMAVVGYLLYSEPLEWQVFLGAVIVLAANLMNILTEQRRQNVRA